MFFLTHGVVGGLDMIFVKEKFCNAGGNRQCLRLHYPQRQSVSDNRQR